MTTKRRGIKLASDGDVVTQFPGRAESIEEEYRPISLLDIRVDSRLQMRVDGLNADHLSSLVESYLSGASVPSIHVYRDPSECEAGVDVYHLADGFHRVAAVETAGLAEISAFIHRGTYRDALRHALGANGDHGLRRSRQDLARAYGQLCEYKICDPADSAAVAAVLRCSERWARELTQEARDRAEKERQATIDRLAAEGKSQREIADQLGVTQQSISKRLYKKRNSSESCIGGSEQNRNSSENAQADADRTISVAPPEKSSIPFGLVTSPPDPQVLDTDTLAIKEAKAAFLRLDYTDRARFVCWLNQGGSS